jgi:hypothetical protein
LPQRMTGISSIAFDFKEGESGSLCLSISRERPGKPHLQGLPGTERHQGD